MKCFYERLLFLTFFIFSVMAHANSENVSSLKVESDLVVQPAQLAELFTLAAETVQSNNSWDWAEMNFTKPFKINLFKVQAVGPFALTLDTSKLMQQEVGFDFTWSQPVIAVGRFEINDVLERRYGGHRARVRLKGSCEGMSIKIPAGNFQVRGNLGWDFSSGGPVSVWRDFQFSMNESPDVAVDLGQCTGPLGLIDELRKAILTLSQDQIWLERLMREGIEKWIQTSLLDLQSILLETREVSLKPGLSLAWYPSDLTDGGGGRMFVKGQMVLMKEGKALTEETLSRDYPVETIGQSVDSGFIMPKNTMPKVIQFLYRRGELQQRISSYDIPAFVDLMKNRFIQFFIWPDLMGFSKKTHFWFDLTTKKAPRLSDGRNHMDGGIGYSIEAPLMVNQWAPADNRYLNYVDFSSQMQGELLIGVRNGMLSLKVNPGDLQVKSDFRPEFKGFRWVQSRLSSAVLGSRVAEYLRDKPFTFATPKMNINEALSFEMKDLELKADHLVIPLEFKSNK